MQVKILMRVFQKYLRIAGINLLLVAGFGVIVRLKQVLPMPYIVQKNWLTAHHFLAFFGWIGLVLALFLFNILYKESSWPVAVRRHIRLFIVSSWFLTFLALLTGYSTFTLAGLLVQMALAIWLFKHWMNNRRQVLSKSVKFVMTSALVFNLLSYTGIIVLLFLFLGVPGGIYSKQNAIYCFLHYQYNGYFMFACIAILLHYLDYNHFEGHFKWGVILYVVSVAVGISLLLLMRNKPIYLLAINGIIALIQLISLVFFWRFFSARSGGMFNNQGFIFKMLFGLSLVAFAVKTILQSLTAIPKIGYMVYEHRAIAIAYLHLVFLIIVTFFLLAFITRGEKQNSGSKAGLLIFVIAAVFTEMVLTLQGMGAIVHVIVPYTQMALLVFAVSMFCGLGLFLLFKSDFEP